MKAVGVFFCALLLASFYPAKAQPGNGFIHELLKRIEQQQISQDSFFISGIFPSYVGKAKDKFSKRRPENNVFSTSIIVYTLKQLKPKLDEESCRIIDNIESRAKKIFTKFENKNGKGTYNFWRLDTAFKFPFNSWLPVVYRSWQLPDDMDCTVMALLAQDAKDSTAAKMHLQMQQYAGYPAKKVRQVPANYKNIPAYSTWFGKKFPVFYDVCVEANVLNFVQEYQLAWTKADSATLQFIVEVVRSKDYLKRYTEISPYYIQPPIILYHLARLMSAKPIPELEKFKTQLVEDAMQLFSQSNNQLVKMILASAICKWGYQPPSMDMPDEPVLYQLLEENDMPFFVGNMLSFPREPLKTILSAMFKRNLVYYDHCPAYNDVLYLEYLLLNKKSGAGK